MCMPSNRSDSHEFLVQAKESGAVAAICHSEPGYRLALDLGLAAAWIPTFAPDGQEDLSKEEEVLFRYGRFYDAVWRIASVVLRYPTREATIYGVTGTNGKTTTAWMIRDLVSALAVMPRCGYLGTLGYQIRSQELQSLPNTTPFAVDLQNLLNHMILEGCSEVAMEVSSHALAEKRADGVEFGIAVFTNLSQDHLDYHRDMDSYFAAKKRLFEGVGQVRAGVPSPRPVINIDDDHGAMLAREYAPYALTFGTTPEADIYAKEVKVGIDAIEMVLVYPDGESKVKLNLGGNYNVINFIGAFAAVFLGHRDYRDVLTSLKITNAALQVRPVPGRFEPVINEYGVNVIIDYAHTPDAIDKLLASVKSLTEGKVSVVFGCGGDRDKSKRPLMAKAAERWADSLYITSDNPRTEDPDDIIKDILEGIESKSNVHVEPDRELAVRSAMVSAQIGDTVVIAGKGHENYQIVGDIVLAMDDRELARKGLAARGPL